MTPGKLPKGSLTASSDLTIHEDRAYLPLYLFAQIDGGETATVSLNVQDPPFLMRKFPFPARAFSRIAAHAVREFSECCPGITTVVVRWPQS